MASETRKMYALRANIYRASTLFLYKEFRIIDVGQCNP